MTAGETLRGVLELTRPVNVIAASVLTFIGAFVAGGVTNHPVEVTAAVAATGLAVGGGNAINDYFDREIDRINQPERAIPRGAVSPRGALAFSVVLFGAAVVLALLLPWLAIAIAAINLVALVAYTELFKGLPGLGNALVAYLVGSTFLFGAAAVGEIGPAAVLFLLAGVATLTREIIKDVEDVAGDREEGLNTLPIAIGERPALWVATALLVAAVLASPLPYVLDEFGAVYLAAVVPANAIMLYAAYESFGNPAAGQSRLKYGMFLAAVAFILGRAVEVTGGIV
ncbi:geranylgeranylglycerol-phosphate geranylgeranyltransferase [Natronococcus occultus]|uniref:Digeranylgeranylglyceryl phosphate synthase n=1 Tax=Natronococcus occultus SP4 TaxID=694430 RepID=L0JXS8_9EURY|nr:geranylgeranylglycerol-phosphate geranylgeranyltransferase [Natronococcus occultus]AGB36909.1 4-hydroxybenzoate polyprenyltransferase-like prenyltransferase [Natronococcus occultus SP4]